MAEKDAQKVGWWPSYGLILPYLLQVPTTFNPWYIIWGLPLVCFYPSWGWLYMSGAISLSYLAYVQEHQMVPMGIHLLEFLSFYALRPVQGVWQRLNSTPSDHIRTTIMEQSAVL
jgi:hypothetical protein